MPSISNTHGIEEDFIYNIDSICRWDWLKGDWRTQGAVEASSPVMCNCCFYGGTPQTYSLPQVCWWPHLWVGWALWATCTVQGVKSHHTFTHTHTLSQHTPLSRTFSDNRHNPCQGRISGEILCEGIRFYSMCLEVHSKANRSSWHNLQICHDSYLAII